MVRRRSRTALIVRSAVGAVVSIFLLIGSHAGADAQQRRQRATPVPVPVPAPAPAPKASTSPAADATVALPRETVTADVSTRSVAVTSSFNGTEIVVFGAVDNSRQTSPEAGFYDIVVVVVGTPTRLVARKKERILGIWLNTESLEFASVPNYYAIASTRPLDEIASPEVLKSNGIGFEYVPMSLSRSEASAASITDYRNAVVRLKKNDRLYSQGEYSVAFIGRSLFRASVDVPANVTVGPFDTRVFLFRNGELLSQYTARLNLEREGFEQVMHDFAFRFPLSYGIATVLLAVGAGLLASTLFRKGAH